VDRNGASRKKTLPSFVVGLGDHLDELFVRFLASSARAAGNFVNRGLAVAIGLVNMAFMPPVDHPAESVPRHS